MAKILLFDYKFCWNWLPYFSLNETDGLDGVAQARIKKHNKHIRNNPHLTHLLFFSPHKSRAMNAIVEQKQLRRIFRAQICEEIRELFLTPNLLQQTMEITRFRDTGLLKRTIKSDWVIFNIWNHSLCIYNWYLLPNKPISHNVQCKDAQIILNQSDWEIMISKTYRLFYYLRIKT